MMRRYIFIFFAAILAFSCGREMLEPGIQDSDLEILTSVGGFANGIQTKATSKNSAESYISNMIMYVFDSDGNIVEITDAYTSSVTNPQYVGGLSGNTGDVVFNIIRAAFPDSKQNKLSAARIVVVANIPSDRVNEFKGITTQSALEGKDFSVTDIARPDIGFPMIGYLQEGSINLQKDGGTTGTKRVLLKALYSKVLFNITVDPIESNPEVTQRFQMSSWTVNNVPDQVRLGAPDDNAQTQHAEGTMLAAVTGTSYTGANPVPKGAGALSFSFYMPEHKVNPDKSVPGEGYPSGISDEEKQRFKSELCGPEQKPAYVDISGFYWDHNDKRHEVTYRVYLGGNNYNNFYVNRDCLYRNNVTIEGITSSKYDTNWDISFDGRVDVETTEFKFKLQRETLLDSHWEIRPIRITLDANEHPDGRIEVEILNPSVSNWLRLEMPTGSASSSSYCDVPLNTLAYGKRRYFTTDLISSTLSDGTSCTFSANDKQFEGDMQNPYEHTIWMYVDEYTQDGGAATREATLQCRYYEGTGTTPLVTENYKIIQKNIYPVSYNGRDYNIEYYEEYLYNFDSRDGYGTTLPDGMPWGLNGERLSFIINAIAVDGVFSDEEATSMVRRVFPNAFYDFYNTSEEAGGGKLGYFPYKGKRFTRKINEKMAFSPLATNANPASAVEYCLNKNKRNSDGSIPEGFNWYLPAIDEIEDICMGGYSDFEVFQDKYYWSSQPAYNVDSLSYTLVLSTNYGNFYEDNVNYARATKVNSSGGVYKTVQSGAVGSETLYSFNYMSTTYGTTRTGKTTKYQDGYQPRTEKKNRIRCVYGVPKTYNPSFGFETSTSEGIWTSSGFNRNTSTKRTGNASGRLGVSSLPLYISGNGTASVIAQSVYAPGILSFYVMYSGDTPSSSTWTVSYSKDKTTWTQVGNSVTTTTSWKQISVDLSTVPHDVFVKIENSTSVPGKLASTNTTYVYIDDIQFTYTD